MQDMCGSYFGGNTDSICGICQATQMTKAKGGYEITPKLIKQIIVISKEESFQDDIQSYKGGNLR